MRRAAAAPSDDYRWTLAAARLILPPDVHLQAPPNLSDDFGALLATGIDDWGGVSPVTADHVNPERPWPDLDVLRDVTEAHGLHAGAAPDDLPRARPRPGALARPGAALPRPRPLPTPRGSGVTIPAPTTPSG